MNVHGLMGIPAEDVFRPIYGMWVATLVKRGVAPDHVKADEMLRTGLGRFKANKHWDDVGHPWAAFQKAALEYATNPDHGKEVARPAKSGGVPDPRRRVEVSAQDYSAEVSNDY